MNYVNTFKKVLLAAGIILLMPMVLSASVFAERRQVEGYGSAVRPAAIFSTSTWKRSWRPATASTSP